MSLFRKKSLTPKETEHLLRLMCYCTDQVVLAFGHLVTPQELINAFKQSVEKYERIEQQSYSDPHDESQDSRLH